MKHRAYIYDRGGQQRVSEIHGVLKVTWARVKDDISTATVEALADECAQVMKPHEVGRYELVLVRDGVRCWEGPITRMAYDGGPVVQFDAKDAVFYMNRAVIKNEWSASYPNTAYCVDFLYDLITSEMLHWEATEDPPINLLAGIHVVSNPDGARTSTTVKAYQKYVWEQLDDMAWHAGIDYAMRGRSLWLNDTDENVGQTRVMTDSDFTGELAITSYGMETATWAYVTDGEGNGGWAGADDPYYGRIELLATAYGEEAAEEGAPPPTQAELESQAERNLAGRNPTPVDIRVPNNSRVAPDTVDELFDQLLPGVAVPVRLSNRYMPHLYQLQRVKVVNISEDAEGEAVTLTLEQAPAGLQLN